VISGMIKTYKFTPRERRLITILALMILIRILYALSSPFIHEYIEKRSDLEKANEELAFYRQRYDEISDLTENNRSNFIESRRSILPVNEQLSSFLFIIEEVAAELEIKIISLETIDEVIIETSGKHENTNFEMIKSLPVILAAEGSYSALTEFAQKLENSQGAFEITQLEFKVKKEKNFDQEIWNINMAINLYYYSTTKNA